jgi:outer membrane protein
LLKSVLIRIVLSLALAAGFATVAHAQRVGFISSDIIRDNLPEAKQAEQRLESIVNEWKRELAITQQMMDDLSFEIKKNRLIWSEYERAEKEKQLQKLESDKQKFAAEKFEPGGEYDETVKMIFQPVEEKIYAAVQNIAAEEDFDIILDQSIQPIPYVNFRYDLTVNVLRSLGVDVQQMEAEQADKIASDPRNQEAERKRRRRRTTRDRDTDADPNADPNGDVKTEEEIQDEKELNKRRRRR